MLQWYNAKNSGLRWQLKNLSQHGKNNRCRRAIRDKCHYWDFGTLELENSGKIFWLHSDVLEKANNSTIAKTVDKSMLMASWY